MGFTHKVQIHYFLDFSMIDKECMQWIWSIMHHLPGVGSITEDKQSTVQIITGHYAVHSDVDDLSAHGSGGTMSIDSTMKCSSKNRHRRAHTVGPASERHLQGISPSCTTRDIADMILDRIDAGLCKITPHMVSHCIYFVYVFDSISVIYMQHCCDLLPDISWSSCLPLRHQLQVKAWVTSKRAVPLLSHVGYMTYGRYITNCNACSLSEVLPMEQRGLGTANPSLIPKVFKHTKKFHELLGMFRYGWILLGKPWVCSTLYT